MLKNKFIILLIFLCFSNILHAHKIPGMVLTAEVLQDDILQIKGFSKRSNQALDGNKIKLFAQANNKILFEGFLKNGTLKTNIPKQPYIIFMYVGNQDVVIEGPESSSGFSGIYASKTNRAFKYTFLLSMLFIFSTLIIILKQTYLRRY